MAKRLKWKRATFRSGKTQAHISTDNRFVIWKNGKQCVQSDFIKFKGKCFNKLNEAKDYAEDYFK